MEKVEQIQKEAKTAAKPSQKLAVVLVAQKDIPPQVPIAPADLAMKELPMEYIQPGAITSLDQAIGQITSVAITAGEQVLKTKLTPPTKMGTSLSEVTPEGKRAVAISVDNISSIAGLIQPGDYVDIFAVISPPVSSGSGDKKSTSRVVPISQNIQVLAVGSEFVAPPNMPQSKKKSSASSSGGGTVTLALTPQEAILLSFIQENGKIKLALRSSDDTKKENIKTADWDSLLKYLYPPSPVVISQQEGEPVQTIEVYHGLRKEAMPISEGKK